MDICVNYLAIYYNKALTITYLVYGPTVTKFILSSLHSNVCYLISLRGLERYNVAGITGNPTIRGS